MNEIRSLYRDVLRRGRSLCGKYKAPHRLNIIDVMLAASMVAIIVEAVMFSGKAQAAEVPLTVKIARAEIGKGETEGDNRGSTIRKYTKGQDVAWCAAFVSWVRNRAGQGEVYFLAARSFWDHYRAHRVKHPKPGDLIVYKRKNGRYHVGIVEDVSGSRIVTIEGNVGRYPAKVKRITHDIAKVKDLLGYVRI